MRGVSARICSSIAPLVALLAALAAIAPLCGSAAEATAPRGLWRGTSTCTDRKAAPACKDESVVYDFRTGTTPDAVLWQADKIVDGQRQPMGELELRFDPHDACWKAEFASPRTRIQWCLRVDGAHMTGTGQLLPGQQIVRRIDVQQDPPHE